jgi:hypothetical protein
MEKHGSTLMESYRRFPQLGFNRRARLKIQPSPEGILNTGEVFGFVVAEMDLNRNLTAKTLRIPLRPFEQSMTRPKRMALN